MRNSDKHQQWFESTSDIAIWLERHRTEETTLVTTNGCFDILHAGHVQYLYDAAALGDLLVVGINSDETVKKLKGPTRPVQLARDRCRIIAALEMVDAAFIFHEDDPRAFLSILQPDIHVKGGDYSGNIIERSTVEEHGGTVEFVPFLEGRSTSAILKQMS